jgi:hypothetical protein
MRSKEQAHDYRYFPEPDLPPLIVPDAWKSEIAARMPELPEARRARMIAEYGITEQDAHTLTATRAFADQFEAAARAAKNPRRVANLVQSELTMRLKAAGLELEQSPISMKESLRPPTSPKTASSPRSSSSSSSISASSATRTSPPSTNAKSRSRSATHRRWKR